MKVVTPSPETQASRADQRHQPWCAADVPPGADTCPRCGCFQLRNQKALVHGGFRGLGTPQALAGLAAKRQELEAHLGGDPSAVQRDLAGDYARVDAIIESITETLARGGPLTPKGRSRAAVTLLLHLMDRRLRLAQALSIERKQRNLPRTFGEALQAAPMLGRRGDE